jgi:predicted  nucleic acid-binding Zn-ribbon protein
VTREQRRLEDEVASLQAKADGEQVRLYSGTVSAPRELQSIQEEIDGLVRRRRGLEDELLEIMEQAEPLLADRERLEAEQGAETAAADEARQLLAAAEAVVDAELDGVAADRHQLVAKVSPELLKTYEGLRARLGGIGVARLEGNRCTGCHLTIPATELDAVRHAAPGAVVIHEECGRILVR